MMITIKVSRNDTDEDIEYVRYLMREGMDAQNCPRDNCKECSHRWGCLALRNAIEYLERI